MWSSFNAEVLEDEPPLAPPPTLQVWSTPPKKVLGTRLAAPEVQPSPAELLEAGRFGSSSSRIGSDSTEKLSMRGRLSGEAGKEGLNHVAGNKADHGDLKDLHNGRVAGFKAESGDLRNLRKGFPGEGSVGGSSHLKFRNTKSSSLGVLDSPAGDAESSQPDGWAKKPKDAAYAALRYLGLLPSSTAKSSSAKPAMPTASLVGHFLEFALSVCFASASECRALAEAAGPEDKKALLRLMALAERTHLLGRGVVISPVTEATLSPAELVFAFLGASGRSRQGYGRNNSASSMMSGRGRSYHSRVRFDDSPESPEENRSFEAGENEHVNGAYVNNLPRADSLHSNQSGLGAFGRSQSDFSSSSYADFNRKRDEDANAANASRAAPTVASSDFSPAFVEFLMVVLKGQDPPRDRSSKGTELVLDVKLDEQFYRSSEHDSDDAASVLTYHSHCDASLMGSDGEEAEPISAEIARIEGEKGKQTLRIMFNSKCLKSQNRWQQHLLAQQRALLGVVTGRLKAAEMSLRADEEVKEEERELLRGFRKIVRREPGADAVQAPVEIFVVEQHPHRRAEAQELCKILSYTCQSFTSFSKATQAVAQASQGTIQRVVSMISQKSGRSNPGVRDLLMDRPGSNLSDWRCRAICTTGRNTGSVMLERPTQIVFLGMAWLARGLQLPPEWQQQAVSVILITEASEFENVGLHLEASGEGEIREKLRAKGICDYLIHPLSLDSLSTVISNAEERRLEEYLLLDILGRGGTACVHKAKRFLDNETLALKEINMRRLSKAAKEGIDRELRLMRELSWPTIIFTLDSWENEKEKLRYVVMPVLEGGSLSQRIETARLGAEHESQYSVDRVADWFVQMIHGLSYLHWRGVVHRDIKPGNLLTGQDSRLLQIGDLGSAMLLPGTGPWPNPHAKVRAPVTSPSYASPEALLQEIHLAASDVWCAGACFFEVLTLRPLFPEPKSILEAQDHVRAWDPSMAPPTNGATNYALAALSTLNQLRCSSSSSAAAVELAGSLPELLRPDAMQRPTASSIASRYFCLKRVKTLLKETGAVPKGLLSDHTEDYKTILKQSQAAKSLSAEDAGVSPVDSPASRGRGPRPRREIL